jgi:hypothetical protein
MVPLIQPAIKSLSGFAGMTPGGREGEGEMGPSRPPRAEEGEAEEKLKSEERTPWYIEK